MLRIRRIILTLSCVFTIFLTISATARAAITTTGNVDPADASAWTSSTHATIGYIPKNDEYDGTGSVSVNGGDSILSGNVCFGDDSGSTGEVTVDGRNSKWTTDGYQFYVGLAGNGRLTITDGGSVIGRYGTVFIGCSSGSTGEVTVDGGGSKWTAGYPFYVGYAGNGTLTITNGGSVSSSGYCESYLGYNSGSTGKVTVDGSNSTLQSVGNLYVGRSGNGTLSISNGGNVSVTNATYVGYNEGSSGLIQFSKNGGTLTTTSLYYSASSQFSGTGTINAKGVVSGTDMVLDGKSSSASSFSVAIPSQGGGQVTMNLDLSSTVGDLGIGYKGNSSLTIRNGAVVNSSSGYIGCSSGFSGEATVDGSGSNWTTGSDLRIGSRGVLNISNSGRVSVGYVTYVGCDASSKGVVQFGENGGVLTTTSLYYSSASQFSGTGTINTRGIVCDENIVLDGHSGSPSSSVIAIASQDGGQVTMNLDLSNTVGKLGAGYKGDGSLTIQNGGVAYSQFGYIADGLGSTGEVTVSGSGSTWINDSDLSVGVCGNATLNITNGGSVTSGSGRIACESDAVGTVNVSGSGSTWTNRGGLAIGASKGAAALAITNGGSVSTATCSIGVYLATSTHMGVPTGAIVSGNGSTWTNRGDLSVGAMGDGILTITDGGLVSVGGTLTIHALRENTWINMADGGMLALFGDADASLSEFLNLAQGSDAIQWWDASLGDWAQLTTATAGKDYTLRYIDDGSSLSGYTLLTVTAAVPEPGTLVLLAAGLVGLFGYARHARGARRSG